MKLKDIILDEISVSGVMKDEGINDNIGKINISYTNYAKFYKMQVDGERLFYDEANEMIKGLTGLELPERAYYHSEDVIKVLNALRDKGIEADSYEMDVD